MKIDSDINYKSSSIPAQRKFGNGIMFSLEEPMNTGYLELAKDTFIEIEINDINTSIDKISASRIENIKPDMDETRMLFYSMRQIAFDNISFGAKNSKAFYYQAQFMKDYEDNYSKQAPFSKYYPCYQMMGYDQLRTYFTWRTHVRKGNILNISLSYAFLYIYELLNNVGVESPEDGLSKLMSFWEIFRTYDNAIDKYMLQWLKEYHIYYPLEMSFNEFAINNNLQKFYPSVFGFITNSQYSFDLFADISSYDIKSSSFYDENRILIDACFNYILNRIKDMFINKKKCFEEFIFYSTTKESTWTPFGNALFYHVIRQQNRQVIVSEREKYCCINNHWTYNTVILHEHGRKLIGYILKEMESSLRILLNFKYKISAKTNIIDSHVCSRLEKLGIKFPQFIQECVQEFYSEFTRKVITVDVSNLQQIRKDALLTQEKLIVPDDRDRNILQEEMKPILPEVEIIEQTVIDKNDRGLSCSYLDIWSGFREALTDIEVEAIRIILNKKDIKTYLSFNSIMAEVLLDSINQKAIDFIGDTVMEINDEISVYDDYKINLEAIVKY